MTNNGSPGAAESLYKFQFSLYKTVQWESIS